MAVPFPVLAPITRTVLFWIPLKEILYLVRYPNRQSAITGTARDSFRTISGTGLCHFRHGHSLGPVPKLGSMRVVPFPVWCSSSSGTVIHWAPYQNWALCTWSHFRYGALPVLGVTHFVPFPVRCNAISGTVIHWAPYRNWTLCARSHFRYGTLPVPVRSFTSKEAPLSAGRG